MRTLLRITLCICMIILVGGTVGYIFDGPTFMGLLGLIVLGGGLFVTLHSTGAFTANEQRKGQMLGSEWIDRITVLEKRLTDIQDIVIAIDEKMDRVDPPKKANEKMS